MFDFINGTLNWDMIAESLKTENILSFLQDLDPITFFSDPLTIIGSIIVIAIMFFFKMEKTFAILAGLVVLWIGMSYALPDTQGQPLAISDIGIFAGVFMGVVCFWVYMFFMRN